MEHHELDQAWQNQSRTGCLGALVGIPAAGGALLLIYEGVQSIAESRVGTGVFQIVGGLGMAGVALASAARHGLARETYDKKVDEYYRVDDHNIGNEPFARG